jgi:S1-C subfamily serine protease
LRVLQVKDMTPAHIAGILPGDTIVGLDHIPVAAPDELSQLIHSFAHQTKSIQLYRLGRQIELYVDL